MGYIKRKKYGYSKKKISGNKFSNWRLYLLIFFIFFLASAIILKLYFIQIVAFDKYKALAEIQHKSFFELQPKRGEIYLKDGADLYPLAINKELQMAYAVPREIRDKEKTATDISLILGLEKNMLLDKFSDADDVFEILKHKVSEEEMKKIKELDYPGIKFSPEVFRYYPGGEIAAQTVGFVGSDGENFVGRYGIESFWEDSLKGKNGSVAQEKDAGGRWISVTDRKVEPAENGINLVLSINYPVQYEVEKILRNAVEKYKADNGTAIVMEPKTGKILALTNIPGFNPNEYSKAEDISTFINSAISNPYECGSVFKTITMAMGIDDGKINPDTTFVDPGEINEGGFSITNAQDKKYGKKTMTEVLEESINTGAIFAEKQVGNKKFGEYAERFGFGSKTGIEITGELAGSIKNLRNVNRNVEFYTASFGQGITVTPLQLINAYSAIANGGKLMKPQIVDRIIYPGGKTEEIQPMEIRRVISEESSRQIGKMLRSVIVKGHGKRANVPGYLVGGKTGTAQVAKAEGRGYEEGLTMGSFVGYAPIDDPQFAVLVKVYNPKEVQWAESTAAPAFGEIMKFLLEYYKVKPTEEYELK